VGAYVDQPTRRLKLGVAMGTFITVVFPLPKEQAEDYPGCYDKEN
jgi:hypothetical protein